MRFRKIIQLFEQGNVCVCGLRGKGKDVLMGNVIARKKRPYVSNLNYTNDDNYNELDFEKIDCGKNTYLDLIRGKVKYYSFSYPEEADVYISDAGIYLPAQYCNELNKHFPYLPTYFALSRQVSHNNVHVNVQHLGRVWDKIREQSDIYIRCCFCHVLFGKLILKLQDKPRLGWLKKVPLLVIQEVMIYDKYQSALDRVKPCRITVPVLASKEVKQNAEIYRDKFYNTYGSIKRRFLFYFNKSKHDTYYFEELFKKGEKNEKQEENSQ